MNQKKDIPIFFATDDNYVPCLTVALHSMIKNQNKNYHYSIKILTAGLSDDSKNLLIRFNDANNTVDFVDINESMEYLSSQLHTRDYYSKSTYFRLFIPRLFPEYNKALYLDCDIVVNGDISKFYNINIGNNLLGAIPDESVQVVEPFYNYVENALGINRENYFNAGILIMNLDQFRKQNFEKQFVELLNKYTFKVAQDQDYLNVICKDKVHYVNLTWDKMPMPNPTFGDKLPMLIHYNMGWKPWKADGVLYEEIFWNYAKETSVYDSMMSFKRNYSLEDAEKDKKCGEGLLNMCTIEANSPLNYYHLYVEPEEDEGASAFGEHAYVNA